VGRGFSIYFDRGDKGGRMTVKHFTVLVDGDVVAYRAACSPIRTFNPFSEEDDKRPPTKSEAIAKVDTLMIELLEVPQVRISYRTSHVKPLSLARLTSDMTVLLLRHTKVTVLRQSSLSSCQSVGHILGSSIMLP
jgi:hypothetical protein